MLTVRVALCVRSRLSFPTTQSSTARRGTSHFPRPMLTFPKRNLSLMESAASCRRKDAQVHDANPSLSMLNPQPFSPGSESKESNSTTCISISYKLPTARPLDPRIPPRSHNGKADLDPTEWKPADREGEFVGVKASTWKPKLVHPPRCEAYSYLSQFHRSAPSTNLLSATTIWSTPSLSHTTTTTSRSDDSIASTPSKLTMPFIVFKQEASLSTTVLTTDAELSSPSLIAVSDGRIMYSKCDEAGSINPDNLICQKKTVRDGKGSAAASLKQLLEKDTLDKSTPITT